MASTVSYPPGNLPHVTQHTLSYLRPALSPTDNIVDIGCGTGYVMAELQAEGHKVLGLDIVDVRGENPLEFKLWDGTHIPCEDQSFDVSTLIFVLHHVPNEIKGALLEEVRRVTKKRLFVLEDTPRTPIDSLAGWLHGRRHRSQIGSDAPFGFMNKDEWEAFFPKHGWKVAKATRVPRFERLWWRPWARTAFILDRA